MSNNRHDGKEVKGETVELKDIILLIVEVTLLLVEKNILCTHTLPSPNYNALNYKKEK